MEAYNAVSSLLVTLNEILDRTNTISRAVELESLRRKVRLLQSLLKNSSINTRNEESETLEAKILDMASRAKVIITGSIYKDYHPLAWIKQVSFSALFIMVILWMMGAGFVLVLGLLNLLIKGTNLKGLFYIVLVIILHFLFQHFAPILARKTMVWINSYWLSLIKSVKKWMAIMVAEDYILTKMFEEINSLIKEATMIGNNGVVGMDRNLTEIKDRLICRNDKSVLEVVPIVGMGGIGKTALAIQAFKDNNIRCHFDICAWATVTQDYCVRQVLQDLLDSTKLLIKNMQRDSDYGKLGEYLHKSLVGRRYLIIIDDVWDNEILDAVRRFLPDDGSGSRVLITTRLSTLVQYDNPHRMSPLKKQESQSLFQNRVFGNEDCPEELRQLQNEIVKKCRGLPLALVVVGALLSKVERTRGSWRRFLESLESGNINDENDLHMKILEPSYSHLPNHLRPCLLYMAMFPENYEIPVAKLVHLWVAEGFLEPNTTTKDPEILAREYLKDLVDMNLISVSSCCSQGKIRKCKIHDVLRKLCQREAHENNFLFDINYVREACKVDVRSYHRLSIRPNILEIHPDIVYAAKGCEMKANTLLCTGPNPDYPETNSRWRYLHFTLLKVLDLLTIHLVVFPLEISNLTRLRYLALSFTGHFIHTYLNFKILKRLFIKIRFLPRSPYYQ